MELHVLELELDRLPVGVVLRVLAQLQAEEYGNLDEVRQSLCKEEGGGGRLYSNHDEY